MAVTVDKVKEVVGNLIVSLGAGANGYGPTMTFVSVTNKPYLPNLRRLEVVLRDGEKFIKAHIARFGTFKYSHAPGGILVFDRAFFEKIVENWKSNVLGRSVFMDRRHDEDESYGELVELEIVSDGLEGLFKPTDVGLEKVGGQIYNYASIAFAFDYKGGPEVVTASFEKPLSEIDPVKDAINALLEEGSMEKDKNVPTEGATDTTTKSPPPAPPQPDPPNDVVQMSQEEYDDILARLEGVESEAKKRFTALDEREARLDEREAEWDRKRRSEEVDLLIAKLEAPVDGKGHNGQFLELVGKILRGEPFGEEGKEAKLEDGADAGAMQAYYTRAVEAIALEAPRVVPMESGVEQPRGQRPNRDPEQVKLEQNLADAKDALMSAYMAAGGSQPSDVELEAEARKLLGLPEKEE